MAVDGANMSCTACHFGEESRDSRQGGGGVDGRIRQDPRLHGELLHAGSLHKSNPVIDRHLLARLGGVSIVCHIPTFARTPPTMVYWDWFDWRGQDTKPLDKYGLKTYVTSRRCSFVWGGRTSCRPMRGSTAA